MSGCGGSSVECDGSVGGAHVGGPEGDPVSYHDTEPSRTRYQCTVRLVEICPLLGD